MYQFVSPLDQESIRLNTNSPSVGAQRSPDPVRDSVLGICRVHALLGRKNVPNRLVRYVTMPDWRLLARPRREPRSDQRVLGESGTFRGFSTKMRELECPTPLQCPTMISSRPWNARAGCSRNGV